VNIELAESCRRFGVDRGRQTGDESATGELPLPRRSLSRYSKCELVR